MQIRDIKSQDMQTGTLPSRSIASSIAAKNAGKPKILEQVRAKLRLLHFAKRTEEAYTSWIYRYILFCKAKHGQWVHPNALGDEDVNDFLTMLAVERKVAASTQNQALSAILFLYKHIVEKKIQLNAVRAKRPAKLPVVLSPDEILILLKQLPTGAIRLMIELMYGTGLRIERSH